MLDACSNDEMAALIGVNPRTVRDLAARDLLVKIGRNKFDPRASLPRYCQHLRDAMTGRPATSEELRAEKIRLTAAQADMAEMAKAERADLMVSVKEFEDRWGHEVTALRQGLLGLANKISVACPHLTKHEVLTVDGVIRETMERVAEEAEARLRRLDAAAEEGRAGPRKARRRTGAGSRTGSSP